LSFVHRYKQCGGEIWADIRHEVTHVGQWGFTGRFSDTFDVNLDRMPEEQMSRESAACIRDQPVLAFTRWFAWHRVPVNDGKTAWLCWVERSIFWNGVCAFWAYRLPGAGDEILAEQAKARQAEEMEEGGMTTWLVCKIWRRERSATAAYASRRLPDVWRASLCPRMIAATRWCCGPPNKTPTMGFQ